MYLLGRKILTYYPYVPIGDFMGVCCAMVSYDGIFYFGLTVDCACAPDLDRLRDFLDDTFTELREASGLALLPDSQRSNRLQTRRAEPVQERQPSERAVSQKAPEPVAK